MKQNNTDINPKLNEFNEWLKKRWGTFLDNVIMWTECDPKERELIQNALKHATTPIRDSMKYFDWQGNDLVSHKCPLEHYQNLYFYLIGYGDRQFQNRSGLESKKPLAIQKAIKYGQTY